MRGSQPTPSPCPTDRVGGAGAARRAARPLAEDGRGARRISTKAAILKAAGELFATRGVTSTSMEDIAEHAGIAKGSLYYNFASKTGLTEALLEASVSRLRDAVDAATASFTGAELRRAVMGALLAEIQAQPHVARFMAAEVFRTDRDWRTTVASWRGVLMGPIGASFPADEPDPSLRAAAIVGATLVAGLEWQLYRPGRSYDDVLASLLGSLQLD